MGDTIVRNEVLVYGSKRKGSKLGNPIVPFLVFQPLTASSRELAKQLRTYIK
jgi:hypothetical protein